MASSSQIRRIATNPGAYMRFVTTGELPQRQKPQGPLFELLSRIAPRDRAMIAGLVVDARLGYVGSRSFRNAEAAFRWIAPAPEMVEGQAWPAEAARVKCYRQPLHLDDLLACAAHHPPEILQIYGSLRRVTRCTAEASSAPQQRS